MNQGRRLPPLPPREGPEELYEDIDAYRDYLALSSVLEDQYLAMDRQQVEVEQELKPKKLTATDSTNSYVF